MKFLNNGKPKLEIVYEDEDILLLNKPSKFQFNIDDFLLYYLQENKKSEFLKDLYLKQLTYLDTDASGLLLLTKTINAFKELTFQLKKNSLKKYYCAIVAGKIFSNEEIELEIDDSITKTVFEIIKVSNSYSFENISCIKVQPVDEKKHQVRKHLAAINHPVIGDKKYGIDYSTAKCKDLYLCATELKFPHPTTYEIMNFKIEPPKNFTSLINREKRKWNTFNK